MCSATSRAPARRCRRSIATTRARLLYLEDLGDITFESRVLDAGDDVRGRYYRQAIDQLVSAAVLRRRASRSRAASPSRAASTSSCSSGSSIIFASTVSRRRGTRRRASEREELERHLQRHRRGARRRAARLRPSRLPEPQPDGAGVAARLDCASSISRTRCSDARLRPRRPVARQLRRAVAVAARRARRRPRRQGQASSRRRFERLFDLQTVQRKLKDAGRFVFIDRVKKNPSFLVHIPNSLDYVAGCAVASARAQVFAGNS